jgi:hypothetical protein
VSLSLELLCARRPQTQPQVLPVTIKTWGGSAAQASVAEGLQQLILIASASLNDGKAMRSMETRSHSWVLVDNLGCAHSVCVVCVRACVRACVCVCVCVS